MVRTSKFRHIRGDNSKETYNHIKVTRNTADASFCAVNPKFVAVVWEGAGGGPFLVLPIEQFGRVPTTPALVNGHTLKVTELAWSPFNDNLIASASEDTNVMLWEIPDGGLTETMNQPWQKLEAHEKKLNLIAWHPTAEYILATGGADTKVIVWNVLDGEAVYTLDHPDGVSCIAWNFNGSLLATTCKDKALRIYDPREQKVLQEKPEMFTGTKPNKCAFLKDGRLFTIGSAKSSARMYALYNSKDLSKVIASGEIDSESGTLTLHIDIDNNIVFYIGKGGTQIRYFEVDNEDPYVHDYRTVYTASHNIRGFGWMPKRGLNVTTCEIARCYKLFEDKCEPVSMVVPRKSENFQEDIYPPCVSDDPSMTAAEWIGGKNADPKTTSTKAMFEASKGVKGGSVRTSNKKARPLAVARSVKYDAGEDADLQKILEEMKKMRSTLDTVCTRLMAVEKKVGINAGNF